MNKYRTIWMAAGGIILLVIVFMAGQNYAARQVTEKKSGADFPVDSPSMSVDTVRTDVGTAIEDQVFYNLNSQWLFLKSNEIGISFNYPVPVGEVTFNFQDYTDRDNDPAGQIYNWEIRTGTEGNYGYSYSFAGGVSKGFKMGRERWFTDFYELKESDYEKAKKVFKTKYGTDAVWRDSPLRDMETGEADPNDKGTVLLINLPIEKDPRFHGIAIYFRDPITSGDALKVVESITVD